MSLQMWEDFRADLLRQIDEENTRLAELQSGSVNIRSKQQGGDWVDYTEAEIKRTTYIINMMSNVVAKIEKEHLANGEQE